MRTQNTSRPFSASTLGDQFHPSQEFSAEDAAAAVPQVAYTEDRAVLKDLRYYSYGAGFVTFPSAVAKEVWRIGQAANYDLSADELKAALTACYAGGA